MEIEIASDRQIFGKLKAQRVAKGLDEKTVAEKVGCSASTYGRWEDLESVGNARQIAAAGAVLGLSPNQVFLKSSYPGSGKSPLSEEEMIKCIPLMLAVERLALLCRGSGENPIDILTDYLQNMNDRLEGITKPAGTVIQHNPETNITTYEAPASSVGDYAPPYGNRKKKKG